MIIILGIYYLWYHIISQSQVDTSHYWFFLMPLLSAAGEPFWKCGGFTNTLDHIISQSQLDTSHYIIDFVKKNKRGKSVFIQEGGIVRFKDISLILHLDSYYLIGYNHFQKSGIILILVRGYGRVSILIILHFSHSFRIPFPPILSKTLLQGRSLLILWHYYSRHGNFLSSFDNIV